MNETDNINETDTPESTNDALRELLGQYATAEAARIIGEVGALMIELDPLRKHITNPVTKLIAEAILSTSRISGAAIMLQQGEEVPLS